MRFKHWIEENGLKLNFVGKKLGKSRDRVSQWANGRAIPSPADMKNISELTRYEVTSNDFYDHYYERHPVEAEQ